MDKEVTEERDQALPNDHYTSGNAEVKAPKHYKKRWLPVITGLLMASLIMGALLNSLGNDAPIKARAAEVMGLVPNGTKPEAGHLPNYVWLFGNLFPIGGLVGSLFIAYTVNKWGRKISIYILTFFIFVGAGLKIASYNLHISVLFAGRFFDGFGAAGGMTAAILLLFELLPEHLHSIYKPLIQININLGIMLKQIFNLNIVAKGMYHHYFSVSIVLAFIQLVCTMLLPESPLFLFLNKKDPEAAERAFRKVRGHAAKESMDYIKRTTNKVDSISIWKLITSRRLLKPILSSVIMHMGQQLCGINAVMAFSTNFLARAGLKAPDMNALIINGMALFGSFIFAPFVSNKKRKTLLLVGHGGIFLSILGLIICHFASAPPFVNIVFLSFFVFIFQIGPGPLVWFITLEIFPPEATEAAQSICVAANWLANSIIFSIGGMGFVILYPFLAINCFLLIYYSFFVAETLNREPEEILDEYERRFKVCRC